MNLFKIGLLIFAVSTLSACGPTAQEAIVLNTNSLKSPETVGTLPDGQILQVVVVRRADNAYPHYVYFVGNTVTVNHSVSSGKTTRNDVQAFIGYADKDILEKAKEIQKEQDEKDRAEYQRLQEKFGKQQ